MIGDLASAALAMGSHLKMSQTSLAKPLSQNFLHRSLACPPEPGEGWQANGENKFIFFTQQLLADLF